MRINKIVLGLSTLAAAGALALSGCSTGSAGSTGAAPQVGQTATAATTASEAATPTSSTPDGSTPSTPTKSTVPAVAPPAPPTIQQAAAVTPGVPCAATAKACVSLSGRKAWILRNGQVVYGPVSIMPGSPRFPTPTGTFHVLFKNAHYRSREFNNAPMPESTFFFPGDAFHVGSLSVYSHGCIHMSWASGTKFFDSLNVGDIVQVVP